MGILPTPRREAFAQSLSVGKTADEAYVAAGYKANRGNAARMKANECIFRRVAELQAEAAANHAVTREKLAYQLQAVVDEARAAGQHGAAVAGLTALARLFGLLHQQDAKCVTLNVLRPYARMPAPLDDFDEWRRTYATPVAKPK